MSNYLTNLVAKSLNQLEVVRPRLPSWFEPVSGAAAGSLLSQNLNEEVLGVEVPTAQSELERQNPTSLLVEQQQQRRASQASHQPPLPATERQPSTLQLPEQTVESLSMPASLSPTRSNPEHSPRSSQPPPELENSFSEGEASQSSNQQQLMPAVNSAAGSPLSEDWNGERPAKQVTAVRSELEAPSPTWSREQLQRRSPKTDLSSTSPTTERQIPEQSVAIQPVLLRRAVSSTELPSTASLSPKLFSVEPSQPDASTAEPSRHRFSASGEPLADTNSSAAASAASGLTNIPVDESSARLIPTSQLSAITAAVVPSSSLVSSIGQAAANVTREITEPSQTAPTIQVTIGRIEVRATPPPVSSQLKSSPKPPVMSLDEYLRQRAQGGNR